jgi:hypothetical protein
MYFGTRCQLRTPNQTLTPHSDRRTCAISSVATPGRRIDADCPRTNVAGDPTIRSSPQLDPSVAPASQIRSAQRHEPSQVFRCSTQDFLGCGSFALGAVRRLDFHTKKLSNDFPRAISLMSRGGTCRTLAGRRFQGFVFLRSSLSSSKQGPHFRI